MGHSKGSIATGRIDGGVGGFAQVLLGRGNGSFVAGVSYAQSSQLAYEPELGDVNGDGKIDLVNAIASAGGGLSVRFGAGDGTFGAAATYMQSSGGSAILDPLTLKDINGDGILDAIAGGRTNAIEGYVYVMLGNSDGTFKSTASYGIVGAIVEGIKLADLNGDGLYDLSIVGNDSSGNGYLGLSLGHGDGSFDAITTTFTGETNGAYTVNLADLNNDGVLDMVTAGRTDAADGVATVWMGNTKNGVAPLIEFSLKTAADARQALSMFASRREVLSTQQGLLGAYQSRIYSALNVLSSSRIEYLAAEERIRDADVAEEVAGLTSAQIKQQSAVKMLSTINLQGDILLKLLQ